MIQQKIRNCLITKIPQNTAVLERGTRMNALVNKNLKKVQDKKSALREELT